MLESRESSYPLLSSFLCLTATMRRLLHSHFFTRHRAAKAIAAASALVLLGLAVKPAPKSNAGILDTPATVQKKPQATSSARVLQRQQQVRQVRSENFDLERFPLTTRNASHWRHLLWTTAVVEPQEPFVAEALNKILAQSVRSNLSDTEEQIIDMAMKVATQLYLSDPSFYGSLGQRFLETIDQSTDPEWVAVALSGLAKGGMVATELQRMGNQVKSRFPGWATNMFLQTTLQEIDDATVPQDLPPLRELLTWTIAPQQLHLYVLCRPNRKILCRAILKDRRGEFVQQDGKLWSVPLLLESIHSLGWNFTRGQTPQGIYRIEGIVPQPDDEFFRAYGQFSLVNLFVPFEEGVKQFIPGRPGRFAGSLEAYQALLPPSWRGYRPIQQTYWAGRSGRSLFRIHGSGESPDFFTGKDKNYPDSYEWNPTIGCLSARELYSDRGQLLQSDMPKILRALQAAGGKSFTGYLMVVDVPTDGKEPVSLDTIKSTIASSQARSQNRHNQKHLRAIVLAKSKTANKSPLTAHKLSKPHKLANATLTSQKHRLLLAQSVNSIRDTQKHLAILMSNLDQLGDEATPVPGTPPRSRSQPVVKKAAEPLKSMPISY